MSLLDECIQALGETIKILSDAETEQVFSRFEGLFTMSTWGRIDWETVNSKIQLESANQIIPCLNQYFPLEKLDRVYILWSEASLPTIEAPLHQIIEAIDDVTAVDFDTWLFSPILEYVVEFYHEGDIWIGLNSSIEK